MTQSFVYTSPFRLMSEKRILKLYDFILLSSWVFLSRESFAIGREREIDDVAQIHLTKTMGKSLFNPVSVCSEWSLLAKNKHIPSGSVASRGWKTARRWLQSSTGSYIRGEHPIKIILKDNYEDIQFNELVLVIHPNQGVDHDASTSHCVQLACDIYIVCVHYIKWTYRPHRDKDTIPSVAMCSNIGKVARTSLPLFSLPSDMLHNSTRPLGQQNGWLSGPVRSWLWPFWKLPE